MTSAPDASLNTNYFQRWVGVKYYIHNVRKRIERFLVESFDTTNEIVYEFNRCYFHGHDCEMNKNDFNDE